MENKLVLKLYKNSRGAVIGDLSCGKQRLIATSHPATIAAAIFAMGQYDFVFNSAKGAGEFAFPVEIGELDALGTLLEDQDEGNFMSGFATFSRFDFAHPMPFDNQAPIHWRVATVHLPQELVKVAPAVPAPKSFKKDLKTRNKYVYFPYC